MDKKHAEAVSGGRGRHAKFPHQIPFEGWKDILWRVYRQINEDHALLVAGGAAFFLLLAMFPALAALVSIYGFVADPLTISKDLSFLSGVLPAGGLDLVRSQLQTLASQDKSALSFGLVFSFLVTFWSANSGVKTLFEALNIAYDEREKRSFIKLNLVSFAFTICAIFTAIAMVSVVAVIPIALSWLRLGGFSAIVIKIVRWPALLVLVAVGIAMLFRFGPSREHAKWRWITIGSVLATLVWIAASIGFSFYLENFANYNATYGSLGAVIGFMLWAWISVVIIVIGAELDAEMEHQTSVDSTTGPPQPMGKRGAVVADTLGETRG